MFSAFRATGQSSAQSLEDFVSDLGVKFVFGVSSARAALYLALKTLHRLAPERNVVAMPAYTCFSVAAAVARAGLKIYPVEMFPASLDFDYRQMAQLPSERLLCIITANLFGLVNDVARISRIAHSKGAFVVDDAAQSLGSFRDGRASGTAADIGIFSLGRGKPLPAGEGGVILTDSSMLANALQTEVQCLPPYTKTLELELFLKNVLGSVFLSPRLYSIPNSMKFLKLGVTEFNPNFPVRRMSKIAQALFLQTARNLPGLARSRTVNANDLRAAVRQIPRFSTPVPSVSCLPGFVRFPLMAHEQNQRDQAVRDLWRVGIGATPFYPSAICDITGIDAHMAIADFHRPGAEEISRRLLTLPTHSFLQPSDIERIASTLGQTPANRGGFLAAPANASVSS
ncbi:MAG: aminotransferase class V-fold PLP-dependent enzyme [Candidatus Acidiferrum sp.]